MVVVAGMARLNAAAPHVLQHFLERAAVKLTALTLKDYDDVVKGL